MLKKIVKNMTLTAVKHLATEAGKWVAEVLAFLEVLERAHGKALGYLDEARADMNAARSLHDASLAALGSYRPNCDSMPRPDELDRYIRKTGELIAEIEPRLDEAKRRLDIAHAFEAPLSSTLGKLKDWIKSIVGLSESHLLTDYGEEMRLQLAPVVDAMEGWSSAWQEATFAIDEVASESTSVADRLHFLQDTSDGLANLSFGNQAQAGSIFGLTMSNVPASSELQRLHYVRTLGTSTTYGRSDHVRIRANATIPLANFRVSSTPFPNIATIDAEFPDPKKQVWVLTQPDETVQLSVFGNMSDKTRPMLPSEPEGTTYNSSNPEIATVNVTGLVQAKKPGDAFILVRNDGATAVAKVLVTFERLTTVEGFLRLDGQAVPNVSVATNLDQRATTNASGFFRIPSVPTDRGPIKVSASLLRNGQSYSVVSDAVAPVPDGTTDMGVLTLVRDVMPNVVPSFDFALKNLRVFAPDCTLLRTHLLDYSGFGMAMDAAGTLWIATNGPEIVHTSIAGVPVELERWKRDGSRFGMVAVAPNGDVWATDNANTSVVRFDRSGNVDKEFKATYATIGSVAIAPDASAPEGYYAWYASKTEGPAVADVVRIEPKSGAQIRIPYTNARIRGVAVDAKGRIWVPVEVGGSGSRDQLDGYDRDGNLLTSVMTLERGIYMIDGLVGPDGSIWCTASDGSASTSFNPAMLLQFQYDEERNEVRQVKSISFARYGDNAQPRGLWADGDGNIWTSLVNLSALYREPRSTQEQPCFIKIGSAAYNFGDPTGYLQAYLMHPDADFDGDGMRNREELVAGRNPFVVNR